MSYRVLIDSRAARELERLPKDTIHRLDKAILDLSENPRPAGVKRLRGKLREGWRIRVGHYRVLYRIDDETREIRVFMLGHRRDIYR